MSKVSNCCGAENRMVDVDGPDYTDIGMCPNCKEHCEFIEDISCKRCGRWPHEIDEYVDFSREEGITPAEYVKQEEGTYNKETGEFYCTDCYIRLGMPLGKAGEEE